MCKVRCRTDLQTPMTIISRRWTLWMSADLNRKIPFALIPEIRFAFFIRVQTDRITPLSIRFLAPNFYNMIRRDEMWISDIYMGGMWVVLFFQPILIISVKWDLRWGIEPMISINSIWTLFPIMSPMWLIRM